MGGIANVAKQQQSQVNVSEIQGRASAQMQRTQQAFESRMQNQGSIGQVENASAQSDKKLDSKKDVDGLTQNSKFIPATAKGVLSLLKAYKIKIAGKKVVVLGRSFLVGAPIADLMRHEKAIVTVCHSKTKNLKEFCQNADMIITAVGDRTKFKLTSDMIKQDAIVVDVAISRHEGKLIGDTDYDDIIQKASWATPVPGGVGPMTVAMLLKNTVTAASLNKEIVG